MVKAATQDWQDKRTDESRQVEQTLKEAGFQQVDAYRYNSASIRVRVIDSRFSGKTVEARDKMVERHLKKLPERTQADIMTLLTFDPDELSNGGASSISAVLLNAEFVHPSRSML